MNTSSSSESEVSTIDRIIGRKRDERGKILYKVKFKGESIEDSEWIEKDRLAEAKNLIKEFERRVKKKKMEEKAKRKKKKILRVSKKKHMEEEKEINLRSIGKPKAAGSQTKAKYIIQNMLATTSNLILFEVMDSKTFEKSHIDKEKLLEQDPLSVAIFYDQFVKYD